MEWPWKNTQNLSESVPLEGRVHDVRVEDTRLHDMAAGRAALNGCQAGQLALRCEASREGPVQFMCTSCIACMQPAVECDQPAAACCDVRPKASSLLSVESCLHCSQA